MGRRERDTNPFEVERLVESEHRAGSDLAWIVVVAVVLCVLAIAFTVPDQLLAGIEDIEARNFNGVLALVVVVPLGATLFAGRRYRDAVGAQKELTRLSLHDALTDLPNRRHMREVLPSAFLHARRINADAAIFFIDLDGFKAVNDTYGHEVGDKLMRAVADRLRHACAGGKWVARYAGDEFVIVDAAPHTREHCKRFAKELVKAIEVPFALGEDRIGISASVGIAFGDSTDDPDEVLRNADAAMYDAKTGDTRTAVYSEAMRLSLTPATAERRLASALDNGEFQLLYQPIVALRTGRVVGAEALLRWDDPSRGVIAPLDFLSSLEDTGLIVPVGRWVFGEACRQAARWAAMVPAGHSPLRVTFNASPRQLSQSDFVDDLSAALRATGADPSLLYLELTEAALMAEMRSAWATLARVREMGVGLALDDFGTGFSSLTHLRSFDLELLKLDATYLSNLGSGGKDDAIVRHVASLARSLGIATLAEGVSEQRHVDLLLDVGCELGQGFHFSAPQPVTIIDNLVASFGSTIPSEPMDSPIESAGNTVVLPTLRAGTSPD